VLSEALVRNTWLRKLGTALLAILLTALVANIGLIPAGSSAESPVPVYEGIFAYVAPLAVFWLVLPVNLREVMKAGLPMIGLFLVGAFATASGTVLGMWAVNGSESIGPLHHAIAGMFTGTYVGGSVNFNAVALHYDVVKDGLLYTGAIVVDNIATTLWMIVSLALPTALIRFWPTNLRGNDPGGSVSPEAEVEKDTESVHPVDAAIVLMLGFGGLWLSLLLSEWLSYKLGETVPMMLVLTVVALALAQIPSVARLRGIKVVGLFSVYLFLAVIGAYCDVAAMGTLGPLGVALLAFAFITVSIHAIATLGAARIFRIHPSVAIVASQSNVGGAPSALAIARSIGREDLVLPGILCGLLGNALGTFLGFWIAGLLN